MSLSQPALAIWQSLAPSWDAGVGQHGNKYWRLLQEPSLHRLLSPTLTKPSPAPIRALDLAAGNGLSSRWLASHGALVTATDGSPAMLDRARSYLDPSTTDRISYSRLDVTRAEDLAMHHGRQYDIVLMNMAIMDVPTLEPLADALPELLSNDGVFVATMLHPVFFTATHSRSVDVRFDPDSGELRVVRGKLITEYLDVKPARGVAFVGQETKQVVYPLSLIMDARQAENSKKYYFHRPLHELLGVFFKRGLVLDALEEPSFVDGDGDPTRLESTANFVQLPAVMSFRFRRP